MRKMIARAWRQPLDCGGLTPLWLFVREPWSSRRWFLVVVCRPKCLRSLLLARRCSCRNPKRRQAAALQSLAAPTRRSRVVNNGHLDPLLITSGEETNAALTTAIAGNFSDPPTQAEMQAFAAYVETLRAALLG